MKSTPPTMTEITALAKRRGFVFPGSEIYGGLANTYDFGPLGTELSRNIQSHWWKTFVTNRPDIYGLDSSILMSPKVWEASGHTQSFSDVLIDCKNCRQRTRADHLIEDHYQRQDKSTKVDGFKPAELDKIIETEHIRCPKCGEFNWTKSRSFNLLFQTSVGILPETSATAYLRGEIAQGMFTNFKNILNTFSPKLPFGLAQSGKAFRNEITLGNFIFRTLEFNLAEFEYFFDPESTKWQELFETFKHQMQTFATSLGLSKSNLRWRLHTDQERSHYSLQTEDLDYNFANLGFKEMFGLAYRTDYDLRNHTEKSGVDLRYTDPHDPKRKFIPHVIEPTFGLNRIFLAILSESYTIKDSKTVLRLPKFLAPYKIAVFPLLANKPDLVNTAQQLFSQLIKTYPTTLDQRGNIGKRYATQDEVGTPYCITVDFQTLSDNTVTVRDRDTAAQQRVSLDSLPKYLQKALPL